MADKPRRKRLQRRYYAYADTITDVVSDIRLSDFIKVVGMENTEKPDGFDAYDLYDAVQRIKDNLNFELWGDVNVFSECFDTQHDASFNLYDGDTAHAISFHLIDAGYSYFKVDQTLVESFFENVGKIDLESVSLIDIRQLHQHYLTHVNNNGYGMRFVEMRDALVNEIRRRGLNPHDVLK